MKVSPSSGFTLLEMLVAIAVLALMMVFMFAILSQAIAGWEAGGRRMESAQSARIGMNVIAGELQYAFAGFRTNTGINSSSAVFTNTVPFRATNGLPGEDNPNIAPVPGSQSLFFVAPIGAHDAASCAPFAEVGYLCNYLSRTGAHTMIGQRYYLVRHGDSPGAKNTNSYQDFYYRAAPPNVGWTTNKASTANRTPLVDNCIRLTFSYASNSNGTIYWPTNWPSQTNLPLGVLVTMLVLDNKSANRLASLKGDTVLTALEIDSITDGSAVTTPVSRILREGTTVMRRFVPLLNSGAP